MSGFGKFERTVNLSQFHAGQMVTPNVTERGLGSLLEVEITWYDSSDRTTTTPQIRRFRDVSRAQEWVKGSGVYTDDSRTYV